MAELYLKVQNKSDTYSIDGYSDDPTGSGYQPVTVRGAYRFQDSLTGSYNPNWRSQIENGTNATTNCTGIKYRTEGSSSFTYYRTGHYNNVPKTKVTTHVSGNLGPNMAFPAPGSASSSLISQVRNRAIRKFLDQAKSARSSFEAGQDIGEIGQTVRALIRPMDSLKKLTLGYFASLKKAKRKFPKSSDLRKALSDSYLEYRFGWRPLALDIADAISGLSDRERMRETASLRASATGSEKIDSYSSLYQPFANGFYNMSVNVYCTYSYRIKGAIRLNLDHGRIPVMQALQLSTLNDFAVTAWDLLPFSFVVDYFANVGDIINAITFPFSDLTYCCGTERTVITSSFDAIPRYLDSPDNGKYWDSQSYSPVNIKRHVIRFDRGTLTSLDLIPSVRIALPVKSRPWENIAALISSNTRSLTPFFK